MGFEVPPERIRHGSIAPGIAVIVGAVAIVAAALVAGLLMASAPSPPAPTTLVAVAASTATSSAPHAPAPTPPRASPTPMTTRPLPPDSATDCHGLASIRCRAIVVAAVRRLPGDAPPVVSVGAWDSLLCHDRGDCPRSRFEGYRPLGSALVSFGASRSPAWINVVAPVPGRGCICAIVAWIIRWEG